MKGLLSTMVQELLEDAIAVSVEAFGVRLDLEDGKERITFYDELCPLENDAVDRWMAKVSSTAMAEDGERIVCITINQRELAAAAWQEMVRAQRINVIAKAFEKRILRREA